MKEDGDRKRLGEDRGGGKLGGGLWKIRGLQPAMWKLRGERGGEKCMSQPAIGQESEVTKSVYSSAAKTT